MYGVAVAWLAFAWWQDATGIDITTRLGFLACVSTFAYGCWRLMYLLWAWRVGRDDMADLVSCWRGGRASVRQVFVRFLLLLLLTFVAGGLSCVESFSRFDEKGAIFTGLLLGLLGLWMIRKVWFWRDYFLAGVEKRVREAGPAFELFVARHLLDDPDSVRWLRAADEPRFKEYLAKLPDWERASVDGYQAWLEQNPLGEPS